jgi:5-(carboxyamino)imidazole ribonucleotide synthase
MTVSRSHNYPIARLGIIGGGQLGRMMVRKATQLGFEVIVLDPTPNSPAGQVAGHQIVGDFFDPVKLRELVELADITTFDIETINAELLGSLAAEGNQIFPNPQLLGAIQDKFEQKRLLSSKGIPTSPFGVSDRPTADELDAFGYPLVQKARRGGYDGRGVAVFADGPDHDRIMPVPSMLERWVDFDKELAVIVARGRDGQARAYPVVEMAFDEEANILDVLLAPARIDTEQAERARRIALETITAIDGVGVFGIELFLTKSSDILVNEIAPRTHNSGHYTIEACVTCQFEQHIRAISGLPLGDTSLVRPAAMINLLGASGSSGRVVIEGLSDALAVEGAAVHIYGKRESRPYRKMGHVTVVDEHLNRALDKAMYIREVLRISGEDVL